jgi:hypothetical protein
MNTQHSSHPTTHPSPRPPGAVHAILYAPPGTDCFLEFHRVLQTAVRAGAAPGAAQPLVYAHRPLLGDACREGQATSCHLAGTEEQLVLPGYGVEAVLKNMEYSAIDDKKKEGAAAVPAAAAGADGGGDADELLAPLGEVKGFRFDVLARRRPELRQELLTLRDALMAGEDDEAIKVNMVWVSLLDCWSGGAGNMLLLSGPVFVAQCAALPTVSPRCHQVWDLKDAGLQATSRISQSGDPLALLQEIAQVGGGGAAADCSGKTLHMHDSQTPYPEAPMFTIHLPTPTPHPPGLPLHCLLPHAPAHLLHHPRQRPSQPADGQPGRQPADAQRDAGGRAEL